MNAIWQYIKGVYLRFTTSNEDRQARALSAIQQKDLNSFKQWVALGGNEQQVLARCLSRAATDDQADLIEFILNNTNVIENSSAIEVALIRAIKNGNINSFNALCEKNEINLKTNLICHIIINNLAQFPEYENLSDYLHSFLLVENQEEYHNAILEIARGVASRQDPVLLQNIAENIPNIFQDPATIIENKKKFYNENINDSYLLAVVKRLIEKVDYTSNPQLQDLIGKILIFAARTNKLKSVDYLFKLPFIFNDNLTLSIALNMLFFDPSINPMQQLDITSQEPKQRILKLIMQNDIARNFFKDSITNLLAALNTSPVQTDSHKKRIEHRKRLLDYIDQVEQENLNNRKSAYTFIKFWSSQRAKQVNFPSEELKNLPANVLPIIFSNISDDINAQKLIKLAADKRDASATAYKASKAKELFV